MTKEVDDYLHAVADKRVKDYLTALHNQNKASPTVSFGNPTQDALAQNAKGLVGYKEPTAPTGFGSTKPPFSSVDPIGKTPAPNKPAPAVAPKPRPGPTDPLSGLPTKDRNAYASIRNQLAQYGLESLAGKILDYVKRGYEGDGLTYILQQTPEYKKRFAANDARAAKGLAPLSPADYIATERAMRDVLRSSGLPSNFYDTQDDLTKLIENDISPTELKQRADDAFFFAQKAVDPYAKAALSEFYGVTENHVAAHFLDPKKSEADLTRQVAAAQIAGTYKSNGIDLGKDRAENFVSMGRTYEQAQQDASQAGSILSDTVAAGDRFNNDINGTDIADAFSANLASQQRKIRQLSNQEASLFANDTQDIGSQSTSVGGGY